MSNDIPADVHIEVLRYSSRAELERRMVYLNCTGWVPLGGVSLAFDSHDNERWVACMSKNLR